MKRQWVASLLSPTQLHVLRAQPGVQRTCRCVNEIGLTAPQKTLKKHICMNSFFPPSQADRVGPHRLIAPALAISATAMAAFPFASDVPEVLGVLGVWAIGSTMLGSSPTAHVANVAHPSVRTQASRSTAWC